MGAGGRSGSAGRLGCGGGGAGARWTWRQRAVPPATLTGRGRRAGGGGWRTAGCLEHTVQCGIRRSHSETIGTHILISRSYICSAFWKSPLW